jgi:hypothetical protein
METSFRGLASAAGLLGATLLLGQGIALGQVAQSKNQQGCINALNKDGAKVAATQGKENIACISAAGKGAESDPQGCLTRDAKGKVAKAAAKIQADFDKRCVAEPPGVGVPGVFTGTAAAVANAGIDDEVQLVADVFGRPLANALTTEKAGAKCQSVVIKDYEKTFATYMKGFLKCKKSALKAGGTEAALVGCVLNDPGGKGASTISKLNADIGKNCQENIFPGFCADRFDLASCVGDLVRCRACRMQNKLDGLHANCDRLDDGVENGSCATGLPVECQLAPTSSIRLATALGPFNLAASGSIDIATGGSFGEHSASCNIRELDPLNVAGVGFVCLSSAQGCPAGSVDCAGGNPRGMAFSGTRNIGACNSNNQCENQCQALCASSGASALSTGVGCEGFCSGDNPPNQPCTTDAECAASGNGSCNGQDGAPLGNVCNCQCVATNLSPGSPPGTVQCNLGADLVVEIAAPCDGQDVLITVGSTCIPMTTANSVGVLQNANNAGNLLAVPSRQGSAKSCLDMDAYEVSGLSIGGHVAFFGSTIGDILSQVNVECE